MKNVSQMGRTERRFTLTHFRDAFALDPNQAVRDAHSTLGPAFTDLISLNLSKMGRSQAFHRAINEILKRPKVVRIDSYRKGSVHTKAA